MKNNLFIIFKKIVFAVFCLFFSSQIMMAQSGSIKGTISDNQGNVLPGATVLVVGTSLGTTTDISGTYTLSNVPIGEQAVKVSFLGYETQTKSVTIANSKATELSLTLKESAMALGEVIITSTRRTTNVQETAASVTAISGLQLKGLGKVNVTDFIDAVPGVTSQSSGAGRNRIIFRNVATSTQEAGSPMSATYVDEFSVTPIFSAGPTDIRLVDMERVEVLKGPQGTLFGRSAMSGIVRYITNKPNTKGVAAGFDTYVSSTTDGGFNYGGDAFLNLPITENLAVRAVGYTYQNSGFIDNVELNLPDFNDENTFGGRIALQYDPSDKFSVGLTYVNQSIKSAFNWVTTTRDPGSLDIAGDEGPEIPFDINARTQVAGAENKVELKQQFLNLNLNYDFNNFTATLLATKSKVEDAFYFDQREFVGVTSGSVADFDTGGIEKSDLFELRLVSSKKGFIDWIAGAYYEDSENNGGQFIEYLGPDGNLLFGFMPLFEGMEPAIDSEQKATSHEEAFYGELGFNFSPKTRLLLGYRNSNVEYGNLSKKADGFFLAFSGANLLVDQPFDTKENVSTYKLSLEQKFNEDIFGYALASSGYRRGGFNTPTALTPFSTFNSDKLWNYEVGLKTTWLNGRLIANISGYIIDYNDIQLAVQDPVTFVRITQNVGKAQIKGVEFNTQYMLNDNWRFGFSGALSNPELKEDIPPTIIDPNGNPNDPNNLIYTGRKGDKLPGSATENFSLSANYNKLLKDDLTLYGSVFYRYVGDRLNDFNLDLDVKLPSYSLTDLRIGVSTNKWKAALFADNLFDKAIIYSIDRQGPTFESVPTNRPRTIGLNFSYNFN